MAYQFARYDPTAASPQLILGWYDNATGVHADLPPAAETVPVGYVAVDADVWTAHIADLATANWTIVAGVPTHTVPDPPAASSASSPLQAGQTTSVVQAMTAAVNVSGQRALMFNGSGSVLHADPTSANYQFAGVSMQAASVGAEVMACSLGFMADTSWSWAPNQAIFVAPDGVLTQTVPTSGIVHRVATSITSTSITVHPKSTVTLA